MRSLGAYFEQRPNNFNLIRLVAALLVIYGHSYAVVASGGADAFTRYVGWGFFGSVGVDSFFVISGFLVTASALKADWRRYVVSRILRIYPGLIVCVLLSVFVLGPLVTTDPGYFRSSQTWRYLIRNGTGFSIEWFLPGVFGDLRDKAVNGVLWSVMLELKLYAIVLGLYLVGILQRRSLFNVLAFAVLTVGYLSPSTMLFGNSPTDLHVCSLYVFGMLLWINRDRIILNEFILLGLLCVAAITQGTNKFVVAIALLIAYSVMMAAYLPGLGWFRKVGDYSYGVYLYGWPVQQLVLKLNHNMSAPMDTLLACLIALAMAAVSWHFLEKPLLSLKDRLPRPQKVSSPEQPSPAPLNPRAASQAAG